MQFEFDEIQNVLDIFKNYISDAIIDTLYVLPFLFITYLILEFIEHRMSDKAQDIIIKAGAAGPIIGSILGIIPQCGFSSAASTFYAGRVITLGTLIAVYISTSDEMIPIFIAGGMPIEQMLLIVLSKLIIGIIFGFAIDACLRAKSKYINKNKKTPFEIHQLCKRDHCSCNHDEKTKIFKPAILHTLQVSLFIFVITLLLNFLIDIFGGEDSFANLIDCNKYVTVIITSFIGLIPNCASSVVISQLYVEGIIGIGPLMAGLLDAAGIGLIVLFRNNRPHKQNLYIVLIIFVISVIVGCVINLVL